jgi:UDP-N-acetylmuramoyl-tripeptide--D-alanyl-D-alanine ligase
MQRIGPRRCLRFGLENDADVRASALQLGPDASSFRLHVPGADADVTLPLAGRHSVMNALAAASLALGAGADLNHIVTGLQSAPAVPGRQVPHTLRGGAVLVDDSYNANPGSLAAAIAALAETGTEAWLVLGDMGELGEGTDALHGEVGERARRAGIKRLWTVGELSAAASRAFGDGGQHFDDQTSLLAALAPALAAAPAGLRCLVKGSRASAMDKVVAALLAADRQGDADHVA